MFLANIEVTHAGSRKLLTRGAISVARSFIPMNSSAVDKTTEETNMKRAKSQGRVGGSGVSLTDILTNDEAYQHCLKNTHGRTYYVDATFTLDDMLSESPEGTKHRI